MGFSGRNQVVLPFPMLMSLIQLFSLMNTLTQRHLIATITIKMDSISRWQFQTIDLQLEDAIRSLRLLTMLIRDRVSLERHGKVEDIFLTRVSRLA